MSTWTKNKKNKRHCTVCAKEFIEKMDDEFNEKMNDEFIEKMNYEFIYFFKIGCKN